MMQFRIFLILLVFGLVAAPVLAQTDEDRAALESAIVRYNAAVEEKKPARTIITAGEALKIGKKIYPEDSPSLAQLYLNYGYAYLDAGLAPAAVGLLEKGVEISEKLYDRDDERLIKPLWALARSYLGYGSQRKKKQLFYRVRSLIESAEGKESHAFAQVNLDIGIALAVGGDRHGKRYIQRSYDQFNALYDGKAHEIGIAALWLGKLEFARQKWEKAEPRFIEALSIFEKTAPPGSEFDVGAHSFLVRLYEQTGESDKATQHCQAISRIRPQAGVDGFFPIYKRPPRYPRSAQYGRREGKVVLEFTVSSEGTVRDLVVVESRGGKAYEQAALDAVKDFRYAPAVRDGNLVDTPGVRYSVRFNLAK